VLEIYGCSLFVRFRKLFQPSAQEGSDRRDGAAYPLGDLR